MGGLIKTCSAIAMESQTLHLNSEQSLLGRILQQLEDFHQYIWKNFIKS